MSLAVFQHWSGRALRRGKDLRQAVRRRPIACVLPLTKRLTCIPLSDSRTA